MAGALMPFPSSAGAASSLMGVCQMTFSALAGVLVAAALDWRVFTDQALPLASAELVLGFAAAAVFLGSRKIRLAARSGE
jgi:DHA1 family bicyclomycin/chloramphenicol resistance-like MFS transporter